MDVERNILNVADSCRKIDPSSSSWNLPKQTFDRLQTKDRVFKQHD